MPVNQNALGVLQKSTGAPRIGRGESDVDADLTTVEAAAAAAQETADLALPLVGGVMSGNITLSNSRSIKGKDSGGTGRSLIYVNALDNVLVGNAGFDGDLSIYARSTKAGYLVSGSSTRLSWNANGVAFGTGVRVNSILNEDSMVSDDEDALATQQSIKAYVDSKVLESAIATATASNHAYIDIAIPAGAKEARIKFQNLIPTTNSTVLEVRTSSDGGTTIDDGSGDYAEGHMRSISTGEGVIGGASSGSTLMAITNLVGSAANERGVSGQLIIALPGQAEYTQIHARTAYVDDGGVDRVMVMSGRRLSAAAVDLIRIFFLEGNIESGEIQVSYI
ncbi:MAG: hypothetical protein COA96_14180 [SAR86 cluster bacterium]|uniref:Uncharacterized protein n=1 Tax=SAR86 cluster bacterium TaxID=2030880 RepID=A0A2A5AT95_9GAMM|nr:MAG: hypothetical protein COA96_14180 [SAR86 cluster bacterium]